MSDAPSSSPPHAIRNAVRLLLQTHSATSLSFSFFFSFSTTRARDGDRQQSQTRWAAATAHSIISANKENLEAIVAAFRQKQSVVGCIAALEVSAAKRAAAS
jgi:hypothetical protein